MIPVLSADSAAGAAVMIVIAVCVIIGKAVARTVKKYSNK